MPPICASDTWMFAGTERKPAGKTLVPASVTTRLEKAGMYCVGVKRPKTAELAEETLLTENVTPNLHRFSPRKVAGYDPDADDWMKPPFEFKMPEYRGTFMADASCALAGRGHKGLGRVWIVNVT